MRKSLSLSLFLLLLTGALALALQRPGQGSFPAFHPSEYRLTGSDDATPLFERGFVHPRGTTPAVHSGTLAELADGSLLAAWFGGSREGAADVAIHASHWRDGEWDAPFVLVDRFQAQREMGLRLRKLGNPVLMRDASGRLWLFFVTVSIGGWSTSNIAYKTSDDEGRNWSAARRLVTSPFINISTLVRGRPLQYADGSIGLPVYHELAGKFPELLRISRSGEILARSRIDDGRHAIQPSLVVASAHRAKAFMRRVSDQPRQVLVSESNDSGRNWTTPQAGNLPNPDAAVAAQLTGDGRYLLAFNDTERGRGSLDLALSADGIDWRRLARLESGTLRDEYSYPYLLRTRAGEYHLIYTWQRRRMAHVRFNEAWLEARLP